MKRLAFLLLFSMTVLVVAAQNSKVNSAINYSKDPYFEFDKAKMAIDTAVVHEKTKNSAKAWKVRGDVYLAIAKSTEEKFKTLCENPLEVAIESFLKALALDVKEEYKGEIHLQLLQISGRQFNSAIAFYNESKYDKSFYAFVSFLDINSILSPGAIDTTVIYNAGITAEKAKLYDEAIKYYKMTISLGKEKPKMYGYVSNIELNRGDTAAFLSTLQEGIDSCPEKNSELLILLVSHYLKLDKTEQALAYLLKAIEKDPSNSTYYFVQGTLYDKSKDFANAKKSYEKAVELKSDYFDANYNLGALYFNKGVDMLNTANDIPSNQQAKYDAAVKESLKELEKALPYLEKAHEIDSQDVSLMTTLKEIYFKLRVENDKYQAKYDSMVEQLKAIGK